MDIQKEIDMQYEYNNNFDAFKDENDDKSNNNNNYNNNNKKKYYN
jgi:hypothetical protein